MRSKEIFVVYVNRLATFVSKYCFKHKGQTCLVGWMGDWINWKYSPINPAKGGTMAEFEKKTFPETHLRKNLLSLHRNTTEPKC